MASRLPGASRASLAAVADPSKSARACRASGLRRCSAISAIGQHVGGRHVPQPCRARQDQADDALAMPRRDPQRDRRAHRDAADDKALDAACIGEGEHVVRESGDGVVAGLIGRSTGPAPGIPASGGETRRRRETPRRPAPRRRRARAGKRPAIRSLGRCPLRRTPLRSSANQLMPLRLGDHAAQEGGDSRRLRFAQPMGHQRPVETGSDAEFARNGGSRSHRRRQRQSCRRRADPSHAPSRSGRQAGRRRVRRSRGLPPACSNRFAGSSTIRMRGDPSSSISLRASVGRRDDIGKLWLDAEVDAALLGERNGLGHFGNQIAPGPGACIVGMMRPLVGRDAGCRCTA